MRRVRSMSAADIAFHEITPQHIPGLVELAKAAFGIEWDDDFVAWKYFHNPDGAAVGGCAEAGGRVVASFSHVPARLNGSDRAAVAMQAVDAMVLSDYRRQKLFYQLARQTYARLDAAAASLAYVFPAAAVRTPFVEHFGYAEVGQVPRFVKVVQPAALGQALGRPGPKAWLDRLAWLGARARRGGARPPATEPGLRVAQASQFDSRFDRLWESVSHSLPLATIRDAAYLM